MVRVPGVRFDELIRIPTVRNLVETAHCPNGTTSWAFNYPSNGGSKGLVELNVDKHLCYPGMLRILRLQVWQSLTRVVPIGALFQWRIGIGKSSLIYSNTIRAHRRVNCSLVMVGDAPASELNVCVVWLLDQGRRTAHRSNFGSPCRARTSLPITEGLDRAGLDLHDSLHEMCLADGVDPAQHDPRMQFINWDGSIHICRG